MQKEGGLYKTVLKQPSLATRTNTQGDASPRGYTDAGQMSSQKVSVQCSDCV